MKSTKVQTLSGNPVYIARYACADPNCLWGKDFWHSKTQENQITPSRVGWMRGARCRHRLATRQWRGDQKCEVAGSEGLVLWPKALLIDRVYLARPP